MRYARSLSSVLGFIFIMVFPHSSSLAQYSDRFDAVKTEANSNIKNKLTNEFVKEFAKLLKKRTRITSSFDYKKLWQEDVSVLFVGELHGVPEFKAEVARLIKGFKKSGVKLTHYASEFITKREQSVIDVYQYTPLPRKKFNGHLEFAGGRAKIPETANEPLEFIDARAEIQKTAKENKVRIIGLDISAVDMPYVWGISPRGFRERNKQWVDILMKILKEKPKAKILVYCGMRHSNYDSYISTVDMPYGWGIPPYDSYIKPVSVMLRDKKVEVRVVTLMHMNPWDRTATGYRDIARRMGILDEHFVVSVPKNKAQLIGADFIMNVPETKEEPSYIPEELLRPITSPFHL